MHNLHTLCNNYIFRLGGVTSRVLATGPKVSVFKFGRGRWVFKGDLKVCGTSSFGREVKPKDPCRKILRHVKITYLRVCTEILRQD
jgi:hypothetical protein